MVAFKIESWIWYSVVLLIAISRLYDSPKPIVAHTHKAQPNPERIHPIAT